MTLVTDGQNVTSQLPLPWEMREQHQTTLQQMQAQQQMMLKLFQSSQQNMHQQQLIADRLSQISGRGAARREDPSLSPGVDGEAGSPPGRASTRAPLVDTLPPANAVTELLAVQIPEFAETEQENVDQWIARVDKVVTMPPLYALASSP